MPKSLAILQFAASFAAIVAAWRLSPFKSGRDSNPWWAAAFAALGLKFLFGGLFLLYGAKLPTGLMETLGGLALSLVVCGNSFADAAKTSGVALFACAALLFWGLLGWLLGVDPAYSSFPLYFLAFSASIAGLIRKPHLKGGEGGVYLNLICAFLALIGLAGRYWSGLELFLVFAVLSGWFLVASLTLAITARRAAAGVAFRVGGGMAVALLDPRGRVVFANGRTSLLAGFSPELATGRNFWELFGESQREAAKEWLKGGASGQLDLSTPEGSFIFEARDSFFGTIVAGRADGSSPGGCPDFFGASLRVDPDNGSILECPPDAAKLLGAEGEDMRGRSLWSFARAGRSAALREAIGSSLAGGGAFLATMEGAKGEFQVVMRASTKRSGNLEALELHLGPALKEEGGGNIYAAGVAHDLGNILQAIVSSCESAGRDGSESEREALAFARKSALEGGRLAKSIASGGKKAPDGRRAVNLCEILGEIREIAAHALPPSISLEIFVSGGLPKVDADPSWLKQALLNLIINARDALEGVEGAKISVEAQPLGASKALVRVSDNGPGVEVSLRERIFTPFFTTKGSGKGSGLGLAISRALIEKEGGSLTLAQSGAGAAFEMILPAAPPRDAKILVVDPDPVSRALLADALAARGFEAQLAADGKEALALLSEGGERYAGLVTELLLPGAGPKTLLREAFSKNVNAMVLTSVELDEAREGALKAGARAFCLKPLDSVALSKWLETI